MCDVLSGSGASCGTGRGCVVTGSCDATRAHELVVSRGAAAAKPTSMPHTSAVLHLQFLDFYFVRLVLLFPMVIRFVAKPHTSAVLYLVLVSLRCILILLSSSTIFARHLFDEMVDTSPKVETFFWLKASFS